MIINLEEINEKRIYIDSGDQFSMACRFCKTVLYDNDYLSYIKINEPQTRYFYCERCSEKEDQEISFDKKYIVKSIKIELEEVL